MTSIVGHLKIDVNTIVNMKGMIYSSTYIV